MAWYRVEMEADDYTAMAVEIPEEDCAAVEKFMQRCKEQAEGYRRWVGGLWTLHGPFQTESEAMKGWS